MVRTSYVDIRGDVGRQNTCSFNTRYYDKSVQLTLQLARRTGPAFLNHILRLALSTWVYICACKLAPHTSLLDLNPGQEEC